MNHAELRTLPAAVPALDCGLPDNPFARFEGGTLRLTRPDALELSERVARHRRIRIEGLLREVDGR